MYKMNWLINIIICQILIGQVLSDLSCMKNGKCSCHENADGQEIEITCGSSIVLANSRKSLIQIDCKSNQVQWEKSFNQLNITDLFFINCSIFNTGINQTISILGISEVQNMLNLRYMKINGSLESFYLSKLESVKKLDISNTNGGLILTNKSFEGTPNLSQLFLRKNDIEEIPNGIFKHLTYLKVLDLGGNKIFKIDGDLFDGISLKSLLLDSNNLKTLNLNIQSLKILDVSNNRLTLITVQNLNKLVEISLSKNYNLTAMTNQPFQNTSLEKIRFNYGNFTVPNGFLSSLSQLHSVSLINLNLKKVPENMIWNSSNITELSLASNNLIELPEPFFQDSKKLKVLNLSKNRIKEIKSELLKPLSKLEKLDLSNNLIFEINNNYFIYTSNLMDLNLNRNNVINIQQAALNIPSLKYLKLANNNIGTLYSSNNLFLLRYLKDIEDVDLSNNSITYIGEGWFNLLKLKNINLSLNNLNVLKTDDIQYLSTNVKANFTANPIQVIDLSFLETYIKVQSIQNIDNAKKIIVSSNKFFCDGRNYHLGRFIHNQMLKSVYKYLQIEHNLICNNSNSTEFSNMNIDELTYDWELFNDSNKTNCTECVCSYRPSDNSAIMDCSNKNLTLAPQKLLSSKRIDFIEINLKNNSITNLPNYESLNIRKLDISYNKLITINITQLPKNLTELHLDHNDFTEIGGTNLNSLSTNLQFLTMSGNSWACNCDAMNTVNFIHKYSSKIFDLENITCSTNSSTLLYSLNKEDICLENYKLTSVKNMVLVIILVVFSMLFGLLLALYKTEIKIWISNHILPLPPPDGSKKYDSFVSFSHEDEEFVIKHLVPELEGGSTPFKLCLHYRDWVVGDWIPTQIARSVDESRKTIIVLSPNFVKSVWGLMEFRTAHLSALKERKSRIIIILFGDLSTKNLDPELKAYLSMNTYIKWGDKWFWERLKYAIRHRPDLKKKMKTKILVPDKLNTHLLEQNI